MADNTRKIFVKNIPIGGGAPVSVQSMTNTKTDDVIATVEQIQLLMEAQCDIIRLAVPNQKAVQSFSEIRKKTNSPLVADIHFDYKLALGAIDAGADKIRINPGNIGTKSNVERVVKKAISYKIPIRVGVNSGSIEKGILEQEGGPTVNALVKSALQNINICKEFGATDLILSLKSSDVLQTLEAYQIVSQQTDVPLHIGVTEAGTVRTGTIRSAIALGILLSQGIGDTLRVSLTGDPVEEVFVGKQILQNLGLAEQTVKIISCPTCGRTKIDIEQIAKNVENRLQNLDKKLVVAIMGCEVNGPGEAKHADLGVACGKSSAVFFKRGEIIKKLVPAEIEDYLVEQAENWDNN